MTDQSAAVGAGTRSAPRRLEPDAIGVAQDTVIGMASSAPAATVGLSLAALAVATAYGGGPILILTAIPMLIIANSYRRLNLWNANCGASFEWVGRAINPYLGFLTGWLMVAAYIIGTVAEVLLLGPSVLAVFGTNSTNTWAYVGIGAVVGLIMLVIAVIGIRITARVQVGMALVEYLILIGLAIAGLVLCSATTPARCRSPGAGSACPASAARARGSGLPDRGVRLRRLGRHPVRQRGSQAPAGQPRPGRGDRGRAAGHHLHAGPGGLPGRRLARKLKAASANGTALVYVANALGGGFWAKAMALAIALSVIATTGTGIVLSARIVYGMASYRMLPPFLANISRRYQTPAAASVIAGVLIVVLSAVYFLATSVENAFYDVIDVTGLLFSVFYILTAVATMVYYRRRVVGGAWDFLVLGLLPLGAAGFLGWILVRSLQLAPWSQRWSFIGIVLAGLALMIVARTILRSPFFHMRRESNAGTK